MKKTLQINLGGINFTIEETAFAMLNQYLDSLKKYFSTYEGHDEIVADIESRIAEKFYSKSQSAEIIEIEDVNKIISSMGSVSDFEAIEEETTFQKSEEKSEEKRGFSNKNEAQNEENKKPNTKYFRDGKRRALGGVLAGLSHNFGIDVVWLRIAFVLLAFGLLDSGAGGLFFIAYIVLWFILPENLDLKEDTNIKKFYRNPENKVIGGVCTGLSTYLGIDIVIIRLIFVATAFLGVGIISYLILWIVAPSANSLTQQMQLVGQPLTIENIESSIKINAEPKIKKEENVFTKLLLFPFRILGIFLKALGGIVKPVGSLVKIFAGVILFIIGFCFGIASLVATGAFFGLITDNFWIKGTSFFAIFANDFAPIGGFFAFLITFLPALAIAFLGLFFITNRPQANRSFWVTVLALWFGGIVGMGVLGSKYALNFKNNYTLNQEQVFTNSSGILYLDVLSNEDFEENDNNSIFENSIRIEASENDKIIIQKKLKASGETKAIAKQNAENLKYEILQKDSVLYFDSKLTLNGKATFRNQRSEITLKLPKGLAFKMSEKFYDRIRHSSRFRRNFRGVRRENVEKFIFKLDNNGGLACSDCPDLTDMEEKAMEYRNFDSDNFFNDNEFENLGVNKRNFKNGNFNKIEFGGAFIATIKYGAESKVEAYCDNKSDLDDLDFSISGDRLSIGFEDSFKSHNSRIHLVITTNKISDLDISGASVAKVYGFSKAENLKIGLSGSSKLGFDGEVNNLDLGLSGSSSLLLRGKANSVTADLSGASSINAKGTQINIAKIDASGASIVTIGKVNKLEKETSGGSEIIVE